MAVIMLQLTLHHALFSMRNRNKFAFLWGEAQLCLPYVSQWPKCVDESDFVGKARNSCFCDQNMQIIDSRVYFK